MVNNIIRSKYIFVEKNKLMYYFVTIYLDLLSKVNPNIQLEIKFLMLVFTAQKMKFSIKDFFSFLRIWSHLLKKSLMENFILFAVIQVKIYSMRKTIMEPSCASVQTIEINENTGTKCNKAGYHQLINFCSKSSLSNQETPNSNPYQKLFQKCFKTSTLFT